MKIDKNFFPGWVRKSIAFTIDDGNIVLDKKFINVVKPYGIKGTFNLKSPDLDKYSPEFYREFYRGYGISNHCKYHPFPMVPEKRLPIAEEKFNSVTADKNKLYKTPVDGLYRIFHNNSYWAYIAEPEVYCRLVDEGKRDIEAVFGEGSITTFVWPYCEPGSEEIQDYVINKAGYKAVRKTGNLKDSTNFSLPRDRGHWTYNAGYNVLTEVSELYEKYPDDGELKFFSFGIHSHDYERNNCWDSLIDFAKKFGNRPETYYYATVEEIFEYEDAVNALIETDDGIENPSDVSVYIKIDGERIILAPKSKIKYSFFTDNDIQY